jgi:hypothetical protein
MTVATRTYYDLLGVARDADDTEIRRAWKLLVQVWHPDRFDGATRDEAERMTASINEAYHTLRNTQARDRYDSKLRAASEPTLNLSRAAATRPTRPRYAAAGMGGASTVVIPQPTLADNVAAFSNELLATAKRRPRLVFGVLTAWLLVIMAPTIWNTISAPDVPQARTSSTAMMVQEQDAATRLSEQIASEHAAEPTYQPSPPIEDAPAYEPPPDNLPPTREPRHIIVRPNNK